MEKKALESKDLGDLVLKILEVESLQTEVPNSGLEANRKKIEELMEVIGTVEREEKSKENSYTVLVNYSSLTHNLID